MPRNHSESQLLQIGSKALSNVAGQFSKLGQTLAKPRATAPPKTSSSQHPQQRPSTAHISFSPSSSSLEIACVADEDACVRFSLGGPDADGSPAKNSLSSGGAGGGAIDSGDEETAASSAYEANSAVATASADLATNSLYNENVFLPSVGIVMAQAQQQHQQSPPPQPSAKRSADVCTMSISSVTEHVSIPAGMLDCGSPVRAPSPAPAIRVNDDELDGSSDGAVTKTDAQSFRHSSAEVRSDEVNDGPLTSSPSSSSGLK